MSTKKEIKDYTCKLIKQIKRTKSMRIQSPEAYEYFKELFKGHPDYPEKTSKMTDLKIVINPLDRSYMLKIVNSDGTEDDISWNKCIYGERKRSDIYMAMRVAVLDQINKFREAHAHVCELCHIRRCEKGFHVDHVNYFEYLQNTFMGHYETQPTEFDIHESGQKCFRKEDKEYEKAWQEYHRENAILRILCAPCNLSRPLWIGTEGTEESA
jgi:hypothetical protein